MTLTSTGIIFIIFIIISKLKYDYLIILLILSSLFQSASVLNIGETGIPIYAFMQIVLIVTYIYKTIFLKKNIPILINSKLEKFIYSILLLFFIWSGLGALILPFIFEGLPVFNSKLGIDIQYGIGNQTALTFSASNIAQFIYLTLNIIIFVLMVNYVKLSSVYDIRRILRLLLYFAIFFTAYQIFSLIFVKIQLINDFLYNNPSYYIGNDQLNSFFNRVTGPFLEPSMAGSFFAAFSVALLFENKKWSNILLFLISFSFLILSTSTNGYITFLLTILIIFIIKLSNMVLNKKFTMTFFSIKKILVLFIFVVGALIIYYDVAYEVYTLVVSSKGNSDSYVHRTFSDIYAFKVLIETYGIGCGLGGNRPSSFVPFLLSNVGLVGFILLFLLIYFILKNSIRHIDDKNILFVFILFLTFFISMLIAIPDISYSFFWIFMALLFGMTLQKIKNERVVNANN